MKLLLDQNIPRRLVDRLYGQFPESSHIGYDLTETADDQDIWNFAREHDFVIVTKDDDFQQRSILHGHPPKIVWLRLGNCKTAEIEILLVSSVDIIRAFIADEETSFLPLP